VGHVPKVFFSGGCARSSPPPPRVAYLFGSLSFNYELSFLPSLWFFPLASLFQETSATTLLRFSNSRPIDSPSAARPPSSLDDDPLPRNSYRSLCPHVSCFFSISLLRISCQSFAELVILLPPVGNRTFLSSFRSPASILPPRNQAPPDKNGRTSPPQIFGTVGAPVIPPGP